MKISTKGAASETDFHGNLPPENGLYHFMIVGTQMAEDNQYINADTVRFQVLAGTVAGQEGRQIRGTFFRDKETNETTDAHARLFMSAYAVGGNQEVDIPLDALNGRQLIGRVTERTDKNDKDKKYREIGNFGMDLWKIDNPEVADVPKKMDAAGQFVAWLQSQGIQCSLPQSAPVGNHPAANQANGAAQPAKPNTPPPMSNSYANV